jgi:SNF2 family DNA or RNA helicase
MKLDYYPKTNKFTIVTPHNKKTVEDLVVRHGLAYSETASTADKAVLFTDEPYAAVPFFRFATPRAKKPLQWMRDEIVSSRALTTGFRAPFPSTQEFHDAIGEPYLNQYACVEYCMRRNNALIGDEPGVGKTGEAILLANEMRAKKVAVVCPASIRLQWAENIRLWTTMPKSAIIYPILKSADGVHPHAHWTILSYNGLLSEGIFEALKRGKYDLVILDEIHFLKNNEAQRTQKFFGPGGLHNECGYILGLSGTPLPNRPRECYTIARGIDWEAIDWQSEDQFRDKYNPAEYNGKYSRQMAGRLPELNARLRTNIMVRRGLDEVMPELPKASFEVIHLEENGAIRRALKAEQALDLDPNELEGLSADIPGPVSTVRMMMGIAMAPGVADYVDMLMQGGAEKIFLTGWHEEVLDIWEQRLHKWGHVRVDGKTSTRRRELYKKQFIDDPACGLFIANYMSAGVGTDGLQHACHRAVLGEVSWVPGENEQTVRRLRRGGQKLPVLADLMSVRGSFADRVLGTSLEKLQDINAALDEEL